MKITTGPDFVLRVLTVEEMRQERARLLAEAGMPEEEVRARGDAWELASRERGILQRIRGLDFLLGGAA